MKPRPTKRAKNTRKTKVETSRPKKGVRSTAQQATEKKTAQKARSDKPVEQPVEEGTPAAASLVPAPVFVRRNITAPDGTVRPGWEMWIGDHCFGRADSKELLLASFQRLQSPPESFHWREVRNRMQMRNRARAQATEQKDESWEWDKKEEEEEPLVMDGEEAEGFQELTWENSA